MREENPTGRALREWGVDVVESNSAVDVPRDRRELAGGVGYRSGAGPSGELAFLCGDGH